MLPIVPARFLTFWKQRASANPARWKMEESQIVHSAGKPHIRRRSIHEGYVYGHSGGRGRDVPLRAGRSGGRASEFDRSKQHVSAGGEIRRDGFQQHLYLHLGKRRTELGNAFRRN